MKNERVLVTGGAGFIGSHIVGRLIELGAHPVVLDNFSTGTRDNLRDFDVEIVEGDLRNAEQVRAAMSGCAFVSHQGALGSVPRSIENPEETDDVNIRGTLHVLQAARAEGVKRVVFASSSSVYGDLEELPKREDHPTRPLSPYGVSKLAAEAYCVAFQASYGLETVCLRYFNVFGPRQDPSSLYAAVVPRFIDAALKEQPLTVYGDGEQTRDFTFVENVLNANVAAFTADGAAGQVLNIAGGDRVSVNELASEVGVALGTRAEIVHVSERPGDIRHSYADTSRARTTLGYSVAVGWKQGLLQTVEWHRSRGGM